MAPKRKPDSQTPAAPAAAVPSPSSQTKKKPNRRRKLKYTVRKKSSKKSSSGSPAVKKAKKVEEEQKSTKEETAVAVADVTVVEAAAENSRSVRLIIEHCKQCTSFKNEAVKFEKSLNGKIEGLEISINPTKPRRGCFEVRDEEGNLFVSLLDLKRPFQEMKALNVEEEVEKIVSKIKK